MCVQAQEDMILWQRSCVASQVVAASSVCVKVLEPVHSQACGASRSGSFSHMASQRPSMHMVALSSLLLTADHSATSLAHELSEHSQLHENMRVLVKVVRPSM